MAAMYKNKKTKNSILYVPVRTEAYRIIKKNKRRTSEYLCTSPAGRQPSAKYEYLSNIQKKLTLKFKSTHVFDGEWFIRYMCGFIIK